MKRIENFTWGILGTIVLSFGLYACSSDNETVNPSIEQNSDLTKRSNAQRNGVQRIKYRNFEYYYDGSTFTKTIDEKFDYSLDIVTNNSFNVRDIGNGFQIENDLNEKIIVRYTEVRDSSIKADIRVVSNGRSRYFRDFEFINFPQDSRLVVNACPPCFVWFVWMIIDAMEDDFETACRKTVTQLAKDCAKAGGKGKLVMEKGGWLSSDKCEFSCN